MEGYNYADEIVKDDDTLTDRRYGFGEPNPREHILNSQDELVAVQTDGELPEDTNVDDGGLLKKGFEEGIKNDSITPENPAADELTTEKGALKKRKI